MTNEAPRLTFAPIDYESLSEEDLQDMGMSRCDDCGKAFLPDGSGLHCGHPGPEWGEAQAS